MAYLHGDGAGEVKTSRGESKVGVRESIDVTVVDGSKVLSTWTDCLAPKRANGK